MRQDAAVRARERHEVVRQQAPAALDQLSGEGRLAHPTGACDRNGAGARGDRRRLKQLTPVEQRDRAEPAVEQRSHPARAGGILGRAEQLRPCGVEMEEGLVATSDQMVSVASSAPAPQQLVARYAPDEDARERVRLPEMQTGQGQLGLDGDPERVALEDRHVDINGPARFPLPSFFRLTVSVGRGGCPRCYRMEIAKALILAGRASDDQHWSAVPAGPKQLFPIANRPILFHNLEALRNAGLLEALILVERDAVDAIERAVGDGSEWGLGVRYAEYVPAVGLAGALAAGGDFLGDEGVLVQQGDALLRERMYPHLAAFAREHLDALALELAGGAAATVPRAPAPGYVLSPNAIKILLERPDVGLDPLAGVRERGGRVRVQHVDGCLPCHGSQDALLDCNRRLLESLQPQVEPGSLENCEIQGAVVVHPSARLERTMVRGPVIIGPGARLTDAYVGPYTSIGAGVVVEGAEIEHSIVLSGAELRFVGTRIDSSVIGKGARVVRGFGLPSAIQLAVGDGAQVVLS